MFEVVVPSDRQIGRKPELVGILTKAEPSVRQTATLPAPPPPPPVAPVIVSPRGSSENLPSIITIGFLVAITLLAKLYSLRSLEVQSSRANSST